LIRAYASLVTKSAVLSLIILESNHSVSVLRKKVPSAMLPPPAQRTVQQETRITLLHPFDVTIPKQLILSMSSPHVENFMTSKQLDEFCCNGKYYISC
jgi:hypothetical protein